MIKKLEIIIDQDKNINYSNMKNFVSLTRVVKKSVIKDHKLICKILKTPQITRFTRDWIKEMRIDYILTKQRNLDKLEDRLSIRNIVIMNMEEGYGDDYVVNDLAYLYTPD